MARSGTTWTKKECYWSHAFKDVSGATCHGVGRYRSRAEALAALQARQAAGFGRGYFLARVTIDNEDYS